MWWANDPLVEMMSPDLQTEDRVDVGAFGSNASVEISGGASLMNGLESLHDLNAQFLDEEIDEW